MFMSDHQWEIKMFRQKFVLRKAISLQNNKLQLLIYLFVTKLRSESWYYYTKRNAGLRRGSAAARLLEYLVKPPPGAWMSFSCECLVSAGRGLSVGLITRPEVSYKLWCVQWVWSRIHVTGGHDKKSGRSDTVKEKNYKLRCSAPFVMECICFWKCWYIQKKVVCWTIKCSQNGLMKYKIRTD
jgi:hypothetical protein